MGVLTNLFKNLYLTWRQYLYTAGAILTLSWKWITNGKDYFVEHVYPEPECLKNWNHKFVQLKNIRMHYVDEGPEDGDVLLMVHGFPEFWYSWRFQLNYFKSSYRCIAIDMRGYNATDKPTGISSYNMVHLVDDIRQFIEILGLKKVTLAAHDWGAMISWRFAMLHPNLIERLIICNVPHPTAFMQTYASSQEQRDKSWYVYLFQSQYIPEIAMRSNKMKMLEAMFRGKKAGIRNKTNFTDEDMLAWKHVFSQPVPRKLQIVQPKVLILWGDEDAFLDKLGAELSLQFCRQCRVQFIRGASHWVQQDQPDLVNAYMEQFMKEDNYEVSNRLKTIKSNL
ncbi:CBN-CEEH-2 protein [Caenorhabditis brenneri]|uniref:CBN-CEEH-2 protein n=1 Tax=Caenorhabditis brenneri TaxID=135651 RepID=G0N8Y7_CAEBE|nr:CBN-CEEH-2 protein [Caenorhabditis brenneri]